MDQQIPPQADALHCIAEVPQAPLDSSPTAHPTATAENPPALLSHTDPLGLPPKVLIKKVKGAVSEETFFNTTTPLSPAPHVAATTSDDGEEEENEVDTLMRALGRSPTSDSTSGVDMATSRRLFLTRLSLEDTVNTLESLETFVTTYIHALEGRHDSSVNSRTHSLSVDPFRLSKRPLEDVAEDICTRIQAVTSRLENCSEIQATLSLLRSTPGARRETFAFLDPFRATEGSPLTDHLVSPTLRSVSYGGDLAHDNDDADSSNRPASSTSRSQALRETFGPLIDTQQLDSSTSTPVQSPPTSATATATRASATFGAMMDTVESDYRNSTLGGTVRGGGELAGPPRYAFGGTGTQGSMIIEPPSLVLGGKRGANPPLAAQLSGLSGRTTQLDLQHSNPPPWLMRVPSRVAAVPTFGSLANENSFGVVPTWQYVDPTTGTPVSWSTFGEFVVSERSSLYDRHDATTQTNAPETVPLAATSSANPTSALGNSTALGDTLESPPNSLSDSLEEADLRRYAKQLEAALSPEVLCRLHSTVPT